MALFAVTFRIDYDTEARYDRCYQQLRKAIPGNSGDGYWDDPTSFYLITSTLNSADLLAAITGDCEAFDVAKDMVLVINLSVTKGHAQRGKLVDKDLSHLMALRQS